MAALRKLPESRLTVLEIQRMSRQQLSELTFALTNEKPPPCASCHHYRRCADERIACVDFVNYCNGGAARHKSGRTPDREIYLSLYGEEEALLDEVS